MYICIFNAWNKILYSVFFSLFLVIFYFIQNDSTAYFIDPVFQLFKRTNLGQGIFSLEIFYLFLRRNLTKFGHNLMSLLRNMSSELKLKCFQAMFLKQCMWLSENIKNAFKTTINFNHVILEKYSLKIWTLYQLKTFFSRSKAVVLYPPYWMKSHFSSQCHIFADFLNPSLSNRRPIPFHGEMNFFNENSEILHLLPS